MFDLGTAVTLSHTFLDSNGDPVDPTSITVTIQLPDLTTVTAGTPVKDGIGVYHLTYTPAAAGHYGVTWVPSDKSVAFSDVFNVGAAFPSALVSLAELKTDLGMDDNPADVSDDQELRACIRSATAVINGLCGYSAPTTVSEIVNASDGGTDRIVLSYRPVLSITMIDPETNWAPTPNPTYLVLDPVTGVVSQSSGMRFYGRLRVDYISGRTTVPEALQEACLVIARNLWELRRGGGTNVPNQAAEDVTLDPTLGTSLPPRARELMHDELLGPGV